MLRIISIHFIILSLLSCKNEMKTPNQTQDASLILFDIRSLDSIGRLCYEKIIVDNDFQSAQNLLKSEYKILKGLA